MLRKELIGLEKEEGGGVPRGRVQLLTGGRLISSNKETKLLEPLDQGGKLRHITRPQPISMRNGNKKLSHPVK